MWNMAAFMKSASGSSPPSVSDILFVTGFNDYGNLGLGDTTSRLSLTSVGTDTWSAIAGGRYHSLALNSDGRLFATGSNDYGQLGLGNTNSRLSFTSVGTDTWSIIACGTSHSLGIKTV